ncbi:MAG: hypothetical protein PVF29_03920 [Desulfobacterales bacterium]|jgi:hypothetical protein
MKKGLLLIGVLFLVACFKTITAVKVAEKPMVQGCAHIATLAENTDPGRILDNYRSTEHQDEILKRAANLGATHVVWLYEYRVGSAADAYRCDH